MPCYFKSNSNQIMIIMVLRRSDAGIYAEG